MNCDNEAGPPVNPRCWGTNQPGSPSELIPASVTLRAVGSGGLRLNALS